VTLLDTSLLIDSLAGPKHSGPVLRRVLEQGELLAISTIVVYEWLRGPRTLDEIADQEFFFPAGSAIPFETQDARIAAEIYRSLPRARSREFDIAIAAIAIRHKALLWTLNPQDFKDIPRLRLFRAPRRPTPAPPAG
jgi:predicted nucleic acid-binding protein